VHLNIRKGMLSEWRRKFARLLHAQDIPAKATGRAERGKPRTSKVKGIYRPVNGRAAFFHR
jgi:hypothetical protein